MTATFYRLNDQVGTSEDLARRILAANGCTDPHPALLEDTVREVEYHGVQVEEAPAQEVEGTVVVEADGDVWSVVKQTYEIECSHPACDTVHRHLYNSSYDRPQWITLYDLTGEREIGGRMESRYHTATRTEWVVLLNGKRVADAYATKREAVAEAARKPRI